MRLNRQTIGARWVAAAAGGMLSASALGQTSWQSTVNGNWGDPGNWTSGVPTASVDALINVAGAPYQVTLNGNFSARSLVLGSSPTNQDATLDLNNRSLTLRNGYTQTGSVLLGNPATRPQNLLAISGPTTLNSSVLMAATVLTRGSLSFVGAGDNDICDTDMDHRGSTATWSGTGNILLFGANGRFTNNFASTFTILNDQSVVTESTGQFVNNGRIIKNGGAGTTFFDFTFGGSLASVGTIEVRTGTLRANALAAGTFSGGTLNTGTWNIVNGTTLQLDGVSITTSNATVLLSGATSTFAAIDSLASIGASGKLTIESGRDFTTAGDFANGGTLSVGTGQVFRVGPGSMLTNISGGALTGGVYDLRGRLQVDGASVATLGARLTLDGTGSGLVDEALGDALAGLSRVLAAGDLAVRNGRNLATSAPVFTIDAGGRLSAGAGSRITLNALDAATFSGNRLTGAVLDLGGVLEFTGADVRELAASLTLRGTGADIRDETDATALGNLALITSSGSLTVAGGKNLTSAAPVFDMETGATLVITDQDSRLRVNTFADFLSPTAISPGLTITVGKRATFQFDNAAFTSVPTGLNILPGGAVVNQAGLDAFNALDTIQGNATFGVDVGETRTLLGSLTVETAGTLLVGEQGGTSGAILNIPGGLTQQGAITLGNGQLNVTNAYALGGVLKGDGTITAPTTVVSGTISAGHSPALLTFNTDMTVLGGALLEFEIGAPEGTAPPGVLSDFVMINGALTFNGGLAGNIAYTFIDAFEPEVGDQFVLLRATGGIAGLPVGVVPFATGIDAAVSIVGGTDLVLTVTSLPTPGTAVVGVLGALAGLRRRR